jgi:three-Cys-motif partner protein
MDARYEGREQTEAKHRTLERYLKKLAYKVGLAQRGVTLNYIDAFAGPWESKTDDLSDTSPAIALKTLLDVREDLARRTPISVRAFFVSPTMKGVQQLESLRTRFTDAEIEIVPSRFEDAVDAARQFARGGSNPFTFVFIDPPM